MEELINDQRFTDKDMYKYLSAYLASVYSPFVSSDPDWNQSAFTTDPFVDSWTSPDYNDTVWIMERGNNNDTIDHWSPTPDTVAIILAGTLLSILTASGNLMVIVSFKLERQLRTISNYFLFSLAVADLTIGLISIPLMTVYTADGEWRLGYPTCQFWLSIDYLMCNASVMNLLLISCDRYFSVTRPLTYRPRRTSKKAVIMIACTFLISLILWPPLIIAWPYIEGRFAVGDRECVVQFLRTNTIVTLCTITVAFFGPVIIMIVLYSRVYYVTRTRQQELIKLQAFHQKSVRKSDEKLSIPDQASRRTDRDPSGVMKRIENEAKPWGIQALLEHFSRSKYPNSDRKTSLASSGFEEDESLSLHSGDNAIGEGRPLAVDRTQSVYGSANRIKQSYSSKRKPASRRATCAGRGTGRHRGHQSINVDNTNCPVQELTRLSASVKRAKSQRQSSPSGKKETGNTVISNPTAYTVMIELGRTHSRRKGTIDSPITPIITLHENESLDNSTYLSPRTMIPPSQAQQSKCNKVRRLSSCSSAVSETTSAYFPPPSPLIISNRSFSLEKENDMSSTAVLSRLAVSMGGIASRLSSMRGEGGTSGSGRRRRRGERRQQESKAARTLSAILLAFILTWTPYSLIVCIESFYPNYVPVSWFTFGYYLCYLNSTINPFLYALCNATFRRTFWRIMTGKWSTVKPTHRPSSHHHAAAAIAAVAVAAARRQPI